jgi:hypothetical protein
LTDIGWDGAAAFPEAATVADGEWFASPEPAAVQRQADDAATAGPGAAPAPTTMTATATTGPAATTTTPARSGGAPTDAEIDKWTRALYPSFRRRLCQDLLLDRERSGYSTDIRY